MWASKINIVAFKIREHAAIHKYKQGVSVCVFLMATAIANAKPLDSPQLSSVARQFSEFSIDSVDERPPDSDIGELGHTV